MANWKYLTRGAVLAIHEEVLAVNGGLAGIRDDNMLESALNAPQASMFGQPMFDDPHEIGAAYLFYLCKNHPFLDGNKRTALAATLVFFAENQIFGHDQDPALPVDEWEKFVLDVASGQLTREQTTLRLRTLVLSSGKD